MTFSAYRLVNSIMVVIREASGYKLRELPSGAVFWPTGSQPDCNRMIDGMCNGAEVLMYQRDLEDRAEPILALAGSAALQ